MNHYQIQDLESYFKAYRASVDNPEVFWESIGKEHFLWKKPWNKVLSWDFEKPEIRWFDGAELNITENCIDRHLSSKSEQTAILFEPNDPTEQAQHITYAQLSEEVNKMANVLKSQGVNKGDRVCIYLPMIPELAYTVLACARIGAIHSVVFAGFSASALSSRINDCEAKIVVTADGSFRGAKTIDLKAIVDKALEESPQVETVLVAERIHNGAPLKEGRDFTLAYQSFAYE